MAGPWDGFFDNTDLPGSNPRWRGLDAQRRFSSGPSRIPGFREGQQVNYIPGATIYDQAVQIGTDSPPVFQQDNAYETSYDGTQAFRPGVDDNIKPITPAGGNQVTSQMIGDARRTQTANQQSRAHASYLNQLSANNQQGRPQQARGGVWDQAMPTMAQQMGDLTKDPAGLGRQMTGVGREIGSGLQAAADRMTEAGIGPLAPYSEKNPGPWNYMGPAHLGGESRENLEKRAMGPFGSFFGGGQNPTPYYYPQGGGMSVQNGVGAFAPWDMDIEKQKAMDVYKRQKWDQDGPMRSQMLQQYAPLWSQLFGGGGGGQYRAPNYRLNFGNQQAFGPQAPA